MGIFGSRKHLSIYIFVILQFYQQIFPEKLWKLFISMYPNTYILLQSQ